MSNDRSFDCGKLPWLAAAVAIAGLFVRFLLPSPPSMALRDAWPTYTVILSFTVLLLWLAYLGWRCHRERVLAGRPAPDVALILRSVSDSRGWGGTPSQFNAWASRLVFGDSTAHLLPENTDYYSTLTSQGLLTIIGVTDEGNKPDGKPDTFVSIVLTDKASKLLAD